MSLGVNRTESEE
uniref:Uncharacterized protein n=1 Tax=Anguilla anguilla TaxID=7936 RepID=A0A0E9PXK5_ANGAN